MSGTLFGNRTWFFNENKRGFTVTRTRTKNSVYKLELLDESRADDYGRYVDVAVNVRSLVDGDAFWSFMAYGYSDRGHHLSEIWGTETDTDNFVDLWGVEALQALELAFGAAFDEYFAGCATIPPVTRTSAPPARMDFSKPAPRSQACQDARAANREISRIMRLYVRSCDIGQTPRARAYTRYADIALSLDISRHAHCMEQYTVRAQYVDTSMYVPRWLAPLPLRLGTVRELALLKALGMLDMSLRTKTLKHIYKRSREERVIACEKGRNSARFSCGG